MKYVIKMIQISILLGGAEFMAMLIFGNLTESVRPVVSGAVFVSLMISGVLGIIDRKLTDRRNRMSGVY